MAKKLLDFQASISEVKQINPLFSTCKARVLYTGKNRNMSIITKEAVEKALPTLVGIPIVGEFSEEIKDFKGHGGAIDADTYKYIHTTKPYGFVPESATYKWEEVRGKEYLTIDGCVLWTGRYEEAYSIIERGKGQSMEIEVTNGRWNEEEELYQIDNFIFSALCILGDDVEPAFEDANITAYSLDKDSFKQEFTKMLNEFKLSLSQDNKEEVNEMLKELLKKYSVTVEDLTAKGINFNEISEDELEAKIIEVFGIKADEPQADEPETNNDEQQDNDNQDDKGGQEPEQLEDNEPEAQEPESTNEDGQEPEEPQAQNTEFEAVKRELEELKLKLSAQEDELKSLREFKLNTEKAEHESKVQKLFSDFQLTEEDVKEIEIHNFSVEEIEEKCYAILGRKLATKKNFSKEDNSNGIKINISNNSKQEDEPKLYGGLFEEFGYKE